MPAIGPLTSRQHQIEACVYWGTIKLDYDGSDNIEYWSAHHKDNADPGWTDWVIKKFTSGANGVTLIERRTGSYTGRAALDWA